jgi:hypothetical protein
VPAAAIALFAACGAGSPPASPREPAAMRVVRCQAAARLPVLDRKPEDTEGATRGLFAVGGGRPAVPADPPVAAALGPASSEGSIPEAQVAAALAPREAAVRACAAAAPRIDARGVPWAEVEWRLTVGARGAVLLAAPTSNQLDPALEACVTAALRGAAFPAPPDGRPTAIRVFASFVEGSAARRPTAPEREPWMPFAQRLAFEAAPREVPGRLARAVEGALRAQLPAMASCLAGSGAAGSLRLQLALGSRVGASDVRVGGLGDAVIEACVENAAATARWELIDLDLLHVACDLARGDAQPWRLTPARHADAVVDVSRGRVVRGAQTLAAGVQLGEVSELDGDQPYLVIADPDVSGAQLSLGLYWAREAEAVIVGVRPARGQAPIYVGTGATATSVPEDFDDEAPLPTLALGERHVAACLQQWRADAPLADGRAVDDAARQLAARCRSQPCMKALVIELRDGAVAGELPGLAAAARRAGLPDPIVIPATTGSDQLFSAISGCPVRQPDAD